MSMTPRMIVGIRSRKSAVVVDDFDVVAVGIQHVGGVVAVVVSGALARLAVAAVPGRGRVGVEAAYVVVLAREGRCGCPASARRRSRGRSRPTRRRQHRAVVSPAGGPIVE
jgi:hypothetical protein